MKTCGTYLTKGKQVYVEGRIQTRSYDDKDGKKVYSTEVVADDVILLGGGARAAQVAVAVAATSFPKRRSPPLAAALRVRSSLSRHLRRTITARESRTTTFRSSV